MLGSYLRNCKAPHGLPGKDVLCFSEVEQTLSEGQFEIDTGYVLSNLRKQNICCLLVNRIIHYNNIDYRGLHWLDHSIKAVVIYNEVSFFLVELFKISF